MENFNPEYGKGYRKALVDVTNWLEDHTETAKFYRLNYSQTIEIVRLMRMCWESLQGGSFDVVIVKDKDKPKTVKEFRTWVHSKV